MTIKEIAFKNLLRRKGKAAFILAGLVIGVATVVAVIGFLDTMTMDINHKLEKFGANILMVPKTDNLGLSYGGLSMGGVSFEMKQLRQKDLEKITAIKNAANIAAVGPMVFGSIEIKNQQVLLAGIDFSQSRILKPWWKISGDLPGDNELLIGAEAARILGLGIGDTIGVDGHRLTVSSVLSPTGSQDDQLLFSRLSTVQAMLGKEGIISMAEVAALCKDCPIDEMVRQIGAAMPDAKVMAIQQVVKGRMETLARFKKFSYGISVVIILIGSLVVLVTLMGSVRERTEEIGIFRAIGFRRAHIMRIVFIEAGIVSVIAGILGFIVGYSASSLGLRFFSDFKVTSMPVPWGLGFGAILMAMVIGLAAAAYPAYMAARLDPNDALRSL
ncbi:MAG: FtsX-like permease family protein [Desulfobacteraceae bacterium]|nr:FtsX-like permease family protein [Desulfobacteraceae bacterium]